jgi:hypothetical protein
MFTLCMCADQIPSITTNETQIDRLKNQRHEIQTDVNEVFGTPGHVTFSLGWLTPAPAFFPESCRHLIYGYCVDRDERGAGEEGAGGDEDEPLDMDSELVPLTRVEGSSSQASDDGSGGGGGGTLTRNLLQAHNATSGSGQGKGARSGVLLLLLCVWYI